MANTILQELKKKGWSQAQLARASGLDRMRVNRLILQVKNPDVGTCLKIAKALKVPVEKLWVF